MAPQRKKKETPTFSDVMSVVSMIEVSVIVTGGIVQANYSQIEAQDVGPKKLLLYIPSRTQNLPDEAQAEENNWHQDETGPGAESAAHAATLIVVQ